MTRAVSHGDIHAAWDRIAPYVRVTPLAAIEAGTLAETPVALKLEMMQHAGSFKTRGAFNRLLSAGTLPTAGVIAASGGNHGLAVAYAARELSVKAEIFVPTTSPVAKVERIRALGATVIQGGDSYGAALDASTERAAASGAVVVHAYDQAEVVAGQGTLAREIGAQLPDVDTIVVAVGGGGLIGGIVTWFEERIGRGEMRVVGVETESCPTLHSALAAGEPVNITAGGIAADAVGARRLGAIAWETRELIAASLLVPDSAVVRAQHALWENARLLVEPGGAVALAAIHSGAYTPAPDERVCVVLCGGNVDPASLATPA